MSLFIIFASLIIMVIGMLTIGVVNTILIAASGAGAFYWWKNRTKTSYVG